uniref:Uncharacterized protein n=1 Tax=Amphimedon queenslandica TaxID=400682 RepID=A0A1X7UNX7_AMPQE
HIHVLKLCINFELIPIKFRFVLIFKVAQKLGKQPKTIAFDLWPNFVKMTRRDIYIFIIFSDTYTCPYAVYQL